MKKRKDWRGGKSKQDENHTRRRGRKNEKDTRKHFCFKKAKDSKKVSHPSDRLGWGFRVRGSRSRAQGFGSGVKSLRLMGQGSGVEAGYLGDRLEHSIVPRACPPPS
jgi:hypothetical protein